MALAQFDAGTTRKRELIGLRTPHHGYDEVERSIADQFVDKPQRAEPLRVSLGQGALDECAS